MWRHDQAVDLLVAVVGQREHRPVVSGLAGAHLDPADDAVGTGCGGNLETVAVGMLKFYRLDGRGAGEPAKNPKRQRGKHRKGAME